MLTFSPPDIDECLTDNGGCNQTCVNSAGSYKCTCGVGYYLGNDGKNCYGMLYALCLQPGNRLGICLSCKTGNRSI